MHRDQGEGKMRELDVYLLINAIASRELTTACCAKSSQVVECIHAPRLLLANFFFRGKKQKTRWVVLGLFGFRNVTYASVRREY